MHLTVTDRFSKRRTGLLLAILLLHIAETHQEAQLFEFLTADDRGGNGGGGSTSGGYGAPPSAGYGAPSASYGAPSSNLAAPSAGYAAPSASYGAPSDSYGTPQAPVISKPTYNSKPSYNAPAPSYGGNGGKKKGLSFKTIDIVVPDIQLPDPKAFKAGVLRSKGRIASGLLYAKAGLLRAGANILAKKANALDKAAQAIPGIKAGFVNKLQKDKKGGGGGGGGGYGGGGGGYGGGGGGGSSYGAPPASSYGAPPPSAGYGAPQGGGGGGSSYGGGASTAASGFVSSPQVSYSNSQGIITSNNNFPSSSGQAGNSNGYASGNGNNNLGGTFSSTSSFSAPDSYGSPLAPPLGQSNAGAPSLGSTVNQDSYGSPTGSVLGSSSGTTSLTGNTFDSTAGTRLNGNTNVGTSAANNDILSGDANSEADAVANDLGVDSGLANNGLTGRFSEKLALEESRQSANLGNCQSEAVLKSLLEDIFMGHELIPDVIDRAPQYPLDLTYKTIRTFPGMRLTADATKFKPRLDWPAEPDALYTLVMSNLDINNRKNRTLSEFWHWFVANIPGNSLDDGDVVFELLSPLVLPEGDGDHRFGIFVFKQPKEIDYSDEGGPTDSCSSEMSNGRGPFRSTKNFQKQYKLELTAATFIIIDYSDASMEIACEWQKCIGDSINLVNPLKCGS